MNFVFEATSVENSSSVEFKASQGFEVKAALLRLTPQAVTFEVCSPINFLRLSEVLTEVRIVAEGRVIFTGEATVSNIIKTGTATVFEAALRGPLLDGSLNGFEASSKGLASEFKVFLSRWQNFYRILPEYKMAVADLQNFLSEIRLWLDHLEMGLRLNSLRNPADVEQTIIEAVPALPVLGEMFARFERSAAAVPEELVPVHRAFCRRQLHPLLLSSPFMHRIYSKPLGYAGDYEMIDMIVRNGCEGSSLFAKLLQRFILEQAPALSVRNRVDYFVKRFTEETSRVARSGRVASIYSLGCGPAREIQRFLIDSPLADSAQFRLLDFNEETLRHAGRSLDGIRQKHHRRTPINLAKKSVHHLIKASSKGTPETPEYDLIYCSGLYDYLSDGVCKLLNSFLYDQLLPGGVLIVTNFDPSNPIRHIQEHIFDWYLIYRDGQQFSRLAPDQALQDHCEVRAELTGCNVFLEIRKPASSA